MLLWLFLLFTLMPLLELWLLVQLGDRFGFPMTILVVLVTGILGAALAKAQGLHAMFRIQNELRAGKMPAQAMGDGVLILIAGVLLITPGVITDVLGLSLLLPPVRVGVRKGLQLWLAKYVKVESTLFTQSVGGSRTADENVVEGRVVDAHVVDD